MEKYKTPEMFACLGAAVFLFIGVGRMPYDYYTFLRLVVCGCAGFLAYRGFAMKKEPAAWVLIAIAVVFNPFAPIHLSKEIWQVVDLITAVGFIAFVPYLGKEPDQESEGE
ncbi:hypothetical protein STSP2_03281 [Anaerohalosphaera lusitana]|uniref:Integral membrane protein n=1 Tax=Anaerohalosphaera lusitana TaxID=1936003 RepID=A0A1U9NQ94_9BACT|nr:DUF6804 family protein [Anaerohalosphaera lusitana]AQT70079.1 hypothetical protein STSP2_03281 [Anaerohalosphaera lusitana]